MALSLSLAALICNQISQAAETEADTKAVLIGGANPDKASECLDTWLYNPNTKTWPTWAKIHFYTFVYPFQKLGSLPLLKQHAPHLSSLKDRIAYLQKLTPQWKTLHGHTKIQKEDPTNNEHTETH